MIKSIHIYTVFAVIVLLGAASFVFAQSVGVSDVGDLELPNGHTVDLPDAAENGIVYLGTGVDPQTGQSVEGYAFFHHREGHGGGPQGGGNNGGNDGGSDTTQSQCYALFGKSVNWKTVEPYLVDPTNTRGLDSTYIESTLASSIADWEAAAGIQVIGDQVAGVVDGADTGASGGPDGKNEVMFGSIADSGVIAVTIVWGVFDGPPPRREIVEWDQVYDQVDYDWSANGAPTTMDFHNIAAHELGHTFGLTHPDSTCTEETMYATASLGETKKRSLNAGDIAGAADLY